MIFGSTYGSSLDNYLKLSINLQRFDFDPVAGALEPQIGARLSDAEASNLDLVDEIGKRGSDDAQSVFVAFRLEPQQGSEQIRRRSRGPCLRLARHWVRNGNAVIVAVESAEQLRQTAAVEMNRRLEEPYEDSQRFRVTPVTFETG